MWGELQRMKNIRSGESRVLRLLKGEHKEIRRTSKLSDGREVTIHAYQIPTDQGMFQLSKVPYRLMMNEMMTVVEKGLDPYGPWVGFEVSRGGAGRDVQYNVRTVFLPAVAATSSSVDPNYIAPPRPTAPLHQPRPMPIPDTEVFGLEYAYKPVTKRHVPRKLCECGAHKTGVKDYQAGHSHWCPAR